MSYFPEEMKMQAEAVSALGSPAPEYKQPGPQPDMTPQRTVSSRITLLENRLEQLAESVEFLRGEIERIKGVLG